MVLNHAEESYSDRLSLHSRRYVQYGYSWVDRGADNAYPRRIEFLRRYLAQKVFLLDGKIEQTEVIGKSPFYFYHFRTVFMSSSCNIYAIYIDDTNSKINANNGNKDNCVIELYLNLQMLKCSIVIWID